MKATELHLSVLFAVILATAASAQSPGKKQTPPQAADAQQIEQQLDDVFKLAQVRQSKQLDEKRALADKLYETAESAANDDAEKYVLLEQSFRLAADTGELNSARRAIDALDRNYQIDRTALLHDAVEICLALPMTTAARRELVAQGMQLVEAALTDEQFIGAGKISALLIKAAPKTGDRDLSKAVQEQRTRGAQQYQAYKAVQPALEKLASEPVDPESNTAAGWYYCVQRDDWQRGVPMLALGDDQNLAAIAKLEIANPTDAAEQMKLAEQWWDYADKTTESRQIALRKHAADWYSQAIPRTTGLNATKAKQRIAEAYAAAQGGVLYLDDLPISDSHVGWGTLGKRGRMGYEAPNGSDILLFRGNPVKHSLSTHPDHRRPAFAEIELPVEATRFESILLLAKKSNSPVMFRVLGDGRELFRSPPMSQVGSEFPCRITLIGVRKLRLEVHAEDLPWNGYTFWVEPRVYVKADKK